MALFSDRANLAKIGSSLFILIILAGAIWGIVYYSKKSNFSSSKYNKETTQEYKNKVAIDKLKKIKPEKIHITDLMTIDKFQEQIKMYNTRKHIDETTLNKNDTSYLKKLRDTRFKLLKELVKVQDKINYTVLSKS
jgi:hypothetical protein